MIKKRTHYKPFGHIFIYVNDVCNLRCKYCYVGDRLNKPNKELSIIEVHRILNYFCQFNSTSVTFLGGEPTLHKNLHSFISLAKDLGYKVYLDTNGTFQSSFLENIKPNDLYYLSFSLDGSDEKINSILRGSGSFDLCTKNISHAIELGFDVRITPTLTKMNEKDVSNIVSLAERLGCNLVNFHNFIPRAYGNKHLDWVLFKKDWIRVFNKIKEVSRKSDISVWCPPEYATHKEMKQYTKEGYKGCIARYLDRCSIFPDGKAYLCSLFFDFKNNFAEFRNGRLIFTKKTNEMDTLFNTKKQCMNCKNLRTCGGLCIAKNMQYKKLKINKEECKDEYIPLCPLWKTSLNKK